MVLHSSAVSVTGLSIASALGNSMREVLGSLNENRMVLGRNHRFPKYADMTFGEVAFSEFHGDGSALGSADSLFMRMVCGSMRKLAESTCVFSRYAPKEIGFFCGTTTGGIEQSSSGILEYIDSHRLSRSKNLTWEHHPVVINRVVRRLFPIAGFGSVITTACSSGALAIALGQRAIASGSVKACIVGGFDVLCPITIAGFHSLQILDPDLCRPFGDDRAGINLSEGGAFLLLELPANAKERTMAYLLGSGTSTDGFQITRPDPEGVGMELCMNDCIERSKIPAQNISYINAHGTGTIANDAAEAKAIQRLFGRRPLVSSTKRFHGHALAGTGALEAALSVTSLTEQTAWGGYDIEASSMKELLNFASGPVKNPIECVLSNSFGFGGNNVSLIFGKNIVA
jgi:3-oxoacyl-[acyl-carrier-protein] synthase I